MKKWLSKYLVVIMSFALTFLAFASIVSATTGTTYHCDNGVYSYTPTNETTTSLYGMRYTQTYGKTDDGNYQNASVFMMKTDGKTSKLVTWAASNTSEGYNRAPLSEIAADYEKKHPGWIVVAGINSDQYYPSYGTGLGTNGKDNYVVQPYYPMVMDGERVFTYSPYGNSTGLYVGFANDGSTDGIVDPSTVEGAYVELLASDGSIISEYPLSGFNSEAPAGATTIWTALTTGASSSVNGARVDYAYTYETRLVSDADGMLYIVENPDMAYMNNSTEWNAVKAAYSGVGVDSFFGKGKVSRLAHTITLSSNAFAIDTKNDELRAALELGAYVRIQFHYTSEALNACEAASGYHTVQVANGTDNLDAGNTYNNRSYPRSIFGQTADGTYFLMASDGTAANYSYTVNGTKIAGLNWGQVDAICDEFGVVEAYQDDGGGSVTAILKNSTGGFSVVNNPSEGHERYIMAGLFFVVKDPDYDLVDFTIAATALTPNAISFSLAQSSLYKKVACDIIVTVNGVTKALNDDGTVSFDSLASNTDYPVTISYTADGEAAEWTKGTISSAKKAPGVYGVSLSREGTSLVITPLVADPDHAIKSIQVRVGSNTLSIDGESLTVSNYNDETLKLFVTYKTSELVEETILTLRNPDKCALNALITFQKIMLEAINEVLR